MGPFSEKCLFFCQSWDLHYHFASTGPHDLPLELYHLSHSPTQKKILLNAQNTKDCKEQQQANYNYQIDFEKL
jgi:hypothetical protein